MALETGEVDLVVDVETTDLTRLMEDPDLEVFNEAGTTHQWMMVNNEIAPFNNADFRRAIASAIDKEAVIQVSLQGTGSVSDSMLPGCFNGVTDTLSLIHISRALHYHGTILCPEHTEIVLNPAGSFLFMTSLIPFGPDPPKIWPFVL